MVCYALKANSNLAVVRTLAAAGAGADIVSGGELQRALAAGVPPQRIVFSGVGKSRDEMVQALDAGIAQFNVESVPELIALGEGGAAAARAGGASGQPRRRRRHARQDQHRSPSRQVRHRLRSGARGVRDGASAGRDRVGRPASAHRLADHEPGAVRGGLPAWHRAGAGARGGRHRAAPARSRRRLRGGLSGGAAARPRRVCRVDPPVDRGLDAELVFEPGRYLVADAGVLLSRVLYVKDGGERPA